MNQQRNITILIVDDHQIIIEGYQRIIESISPPHIHFEYESATTCDMAWAKFTSKQYDIVLLDLNFPIASDQKITSGEELGHRIRENYPNAHIIVLTGVIEPLQLKSIIKRVDPQGFLLKGETNSREILRCLETVLDGNLYYSPTINRIVRSRFVNELELDEHDRKILEHLSLGVKTKNLPNHVPLSLRSVEARKKKLREIFDASDDETLLKNAKEAGYL